MPSGFAPLQGSSIGTTLGARFVPRRVGLFGGSFNPPHRAHRALAELALTTLRLDELRWLPAGQPWQKAAPDLAPAEHRAAMVALAAEGEPRFVLDERELRRSGPSWTLDSVNELERETPGAHHWRELLSAVTLAVSAREGQTVRASPAVGATWHRVEVLDLPAMAISATRVREMAARGEDITTMVGEPVAGYIARHHLYSNRPSNGSETP
jgi:nicotinate-nucleotide adenylyltransferase